MRREEVVELIKNLYGELGDLGLTPKIGNNYWPADDSYTLQILANRLYTQDLERILSFAKKHKLEVRLDIRYNSILVEFYDIQHKGGDW